MSLTKKLHPRIQELQKRSRTGINWSAFEDQTKLVQATRALNRQLNDDEFAAYFCVWNVVDSFGTFWIRGAFAKSIRERGPKSQANQKIIVVWQHDITDPIAQPLEIVEDDFGAYVVGKWEDFKAVPNAYRAATQIASGAINGFSFGFDYLWDRMEYVESMDAVGVREAILFEISPVTFASIKETFSFRSIEDFEDKKMVFMSEFNSFINTIPKDKQLELRAMLANYQTLIDSKPGGTPPIEDKPDGDKQLIEAAGYTVDLNKL